MTATTVASREAAAFVGGLARPAAAQGACLLERIIDPNRDCEYGRRFGFADIRTVGDYQSRVPIVRYTDIRGDIDRLTQGEQGILTSEPVRRFFLTSGSTAVPKHIPVTGALVRDKWRAFSIFWNNAFERHPQARQGAMVTNFADFGEGATTTPGGLPCTSESSFWAAWTARLRVGSAAPLSGDLAQIEDYDSRYYTIARILIEENVSLLMTLNPSTIVLLLQKMGGFAEDLIKDVAQGGIASWVRLPHAVRSRMSAKYAGNPERAKQLQSQLDATAPGDPQLVASSVWPSLSLVVCWRSTMLSPYLRLLEPLLGPVAQRDYVSMASEGILAIPLQDGHSGGVLPTTIHFYEFIPEDQAERDDPDVLLVDEVELDRNYAIVLSTSGGLYRYHIGDVVRVTGFADKTPIIEFQHRLGSTCSLTGEKLTEQQVVEAVSESSRRTGLQCLSFTAFPSVEDFPHYVVLVEFEAIPDMDDLRTFLGATDRALGVCNVEYASKRASLRLGAPVLWVVQTGDFEAWRRRRIASGANEDQVKPIHLSRDQSFHEHFTIVERVRAD